MNMRYKFYTTSEKAWEGMLASLKTAQRSIFWESYIFDPELEGGELTKEIFQALLEKARGGLTVKIIADYWGSFFFGAQARQQLENAGAEIIFFKGHRFFGRNHKKILIIDERTAFIGGVNLAKSHRHWLDLHLRLEGPIVDYLLRSFAKSYRLSGGQEKINSKKSKFNRWKIVFIDHWPFKRKLLKKHYQRACWSAQKNIMIATPYFVPHPWLIKILRRAAGKGVKIDIMIPERSDNFIINMANYVFASLVYKPGINFYFTKEFIHAKALLIDDKEGLVGSQNIDALSFDRNIEGGVAFQRQDMVKKLKEILEQWKSGARLLVFKKNSRRWYRRLPEVIFKLLQPIL